MKIAIRLFSVVVLLVVVGAIVGIVTVVSMAENTPVGAPPADSFLADDQDKIAAAQAIAGSAENVGQALPRLRRQHHAGAICE
ncbi:MAG: putative membrane protein [Candidatus Azotimanducaceae bacterium]|jgi:uncharacterized membrane protein